MRANGGKNVEPRHVGHTHIGDNELGLESRNLLEALFSAQCGVRDEAFVLEQNANGVEDTHLVVDDEHGRR